MLLIDSFIHYNFRVRFSSGEGRRVSSPRRFRYTSRSTAIPDSSACSTPRPLGCFPVVVASRTFSPIFPVTFWTHGRTNVDGISRFGEAARHSKLYEFHSCALCNKVSHRELLAKFPSLLLALGTVFLQSLPKLHDRR